MKELLKKHLLAVAGCSALTIAGVLGKYYEGTGPTQKQASGELMYVAYRDTGNIWTVCHGVTGAHIVKGSKFTAAQCAVMEQQHYASAEKSARRLFKHYDSYNKWQQAALIDWLYNLGEGPGTVNSTLRRKFNSGDIDGGCRELVKWVNGRVNGKLVRLPGLVDRREATKELCLKWGRA